MTVRFRFVVFGLLILMMAGCSPAKPDAESEELQALKNYFQALAGKDEVSYSRLVCPDWEPQAFLEFDAYKGVDTRLSDLTCRRISGEAGSAQINCQGKIYLSYNSEKQEVDLSPRTYRLVLTQDVWQVCGFTTSRK
jgi:hypothetical protein